MLRADRKKSMYANYYNLHRDPFRLTPEPELSFAHPSYAKAWAYLQYGLRQGEGFVVVTGRPGSGKTTLMRALLEEHRNDRLITAALVHTRFDAADLAAMVAHAFGLSVEGIDRVAALDRLRRFLEQQLQHGNRALLIIDEAQGLSGEALHELYVLSSLDFSGRPLMQVFLLGQEDLRGVIHSAGTEHLRQRLIAACHLEPLDAEQTEAYVRHRLTDSGWRNDPELDPRLFSLIEHFSDGLPRRINTLCNRLLLYGAVNDQHSLGPADLIRVVDELREERLYAPGATPAPESAPPLDVAPDLAQSPPTARAPTGMSAAARARREPEEAFDAQRQAPLSPAGEPFEGIGGPADPEPAPAAMRAQRAPAADDDLSAPKPGTVEPASDPEVALHTQPDPALGPEPHPPFDREPRVSPARPDHRRPPRRKRGGLARSAGLALAGALGGIAVLLAYDRLGPGLPEGDPGEETAVAASDAGAEEPSDLITLRLPDPAPRPVLTPPRSEPATPPAEAAATAPAPKPPADVALPEDSPAEAGSTPAESAAQGAPGERAAAVATAPAVEPDQPGNRAPEGDTGAADSEQASAPAVAAGAADSPQVGDAGASRAVEGLLQQAEAAMADFRLTTPPTDSALHYYRAVLEREPDNPVAQQGFEEIVSRYVLLARNAINEGRPDLARLYVRRGLSVDPRNPDLRALE